MISTFFVFQFVTCPSVSSDGGPIISLLCTKSTSEVYVSWMAGFHPEREIEWYKLFLNDETLTNEVRL